MLIRFLYSRPPCNLKPGTCNRSPVGCVPCKEYLCSRICNYMSTQHLSEQEIIRREKLQELQKLGIDPYPAPLYPVNITAAQILQKYKGEENKADFADVCLAGRIMSINDMGK